MTEETLTHKDLARHLGVSETTVKSYRRKFPGCIPVSSKGKPIRFSPLAATVAIRIRDLFDTGMSVEEVRTRPAAEFDWISAEEPERAESRAGSRQADRADVSPEISLGVSNMAKSMVAMTQQQKALLSRMQGIEGMLEELGLRGAVDDGSAGGSLVAARAQAAKERQELLENRLNRLDATTQTLAQTVHGLAEQLSRFLGKRDQAAEEWKAASSETLSTAARIASETVAVPQAVPAEPRLSAQEPTSARIIPLRPENASDKARQPSTLVPGQPAAQEGPAEPPRQFFGLPLVVRTEQGQYISAGGKTRGRFSLNDLKAMLIYGFTPPNHFTLRWERHGQGWWLFLEQENSDRAIHLLLMELPTQKGGTVAEILQIRNAGENVHPAEICAIIDSFGA